ncbi:MAG: hypothetical protein ACKO4T_09785 [Planctomycetaceae bacterium]
MPVAASIVRLLPALVAIGLGLSSGVASAQWGGFGFNRGGYASTAQQGADYGMSEMMRAQGYQNLQNSEAAKNWEDAKTLEIQNRLRWTETYFEMRKDNREKRAAEQGPPMTPEQVVRMSKMAGPQRLRSTELDPVTGHIEYPLVLTDDPFKPYRDRLDPLFAHRAHTGGSVQYADYKAIQQAVTDFIGALKSRVTDYPAGEYGKARTFLDSLAREASLPAG